MGVGEGVTVVVVVAVAVAVGVRMPDDMPLRYIPYNVRR